MRDLKSFWGPSAAAIRPLTTNVVYIDSLRRAAFKAFRTGRVAAATRRQACGPQMRRCASGIVCKGSGRRASTRERGTTGKTRHAAGHARGAARLRLVMVPPIDNVPESLSVNPSHSSLLSRCPSLPYSSKYNIPLQ